VTSRRLGLTLLLTVALSGSEPGTFPPDENPRYFPVGVFANGGLDGSDRARWYARQLRGLQEPSLSENPPPVAETVYRFTWLRTFDHPIAVRITVHANGTGTLTAKMADGAGGYEPGKLIANSNREIGVEEVRHLLTLIDAMGFWQVSPEPPPPMAFNVDGAQWILEGRTPSIYHVIDRWSPRKGPFRRLGLYLAISLAGLDVPKSRIY
jgi:hypothetical protein